jgi:hypothetical protein
VTRRLRITLVLVAVMLAPGCRSEPTSILDQARIPDAEGVVEEIGPAGLKLLGGEGFEIDTTVQAFTTRSHDDLSLGALKGRYVHVGLNDEGRVVWVASIGLVPSGQDRVYYTGVSDREEDGHVRFQDGTVLKLGPGVSVPERNGEWVAVIDVNQKVIVELQRQG